MKKVILLFSVIIVGYVGLYIYKQSPLSYHFNNSLEVGTPIDSIDNVKVYYNGNFHNVEKRNVIDGYNIGLKYQCVEFVKRYYYYHFNHKMPNSYGHAKDFYNKNLADGNKNTDRNLLQYSNPSDYKPQIGDIIIFDATTFNPYGHVAIISEVSKNHIEIIQQNVGEKTREKLSISLDNSKWYINNNKVLGRLRKF